MTDNGATPDEQGWRIRGRFYPIVWLQDWKRGEHILANRITGLGDELFDGGHAVALDTAYMAVAVWRVNPTQPIEKIIRFVFELSDADVEEVGLTEVDEEEATDEDPTPGDASPPPSSSPASGEASSNAT
jgi:hypothetical protein